MGGGLRPPFSAFLHLVQWDGRAYALPYLLNRDAGRKPIEKVLIISAGTGNDVSRALHWEAEQIAAVDIDPVILELRPSRPPRPAVSGFARKSVDQHT